MNREGKIPASRQSMQSYIYTLVLYQRNIKSKQAKLFWGPEAAFGEVSCAALRFTRMLGEIYCSRLIRSLFVYLCDVFRTLITSLYFSILHKRSRPHSVQITLTLSIRAWSWMDPLIICELSSAEETSVYASASHQHGEYLSNIL